MPANFLLVFSFVLWFLMPLISMTFMREVSMSDARMPTSCLCRFFENLVDLQPRWI